MLCERRLEHISSTSGRIFTLPSIFIAGSIELSHSLAATSSRSCLCGALIIVSARSSRARATLSVDASGVWVWPVCSCRGGDPARARVASRDRIANRALSNHTHTLSYSIARCTHLTSTYRLRYLIFRRLLIAYIKRTTCTTVNTSEPISSSRTRHLLMPNAWHPQCSMRLSPNSPSSRQELTFQFTSSRRHTAPVHVPSQQLLSSRTTFMRTGQRGRHRARGSCVCCGHSRTCPTSRWRKLPRPASPLGERAHPWRWTT